jgi:hypothetical protein
MGYGGNHVRARADTSSNFSRKRQERLYAANASRLKALLDNSFLYCQRKTFSSGSRD